MLCGMSSEELVAFLCPIATYSESSRLSRVRGKQLAAWIYRKGAESFEEMTDLPVSLRKELESRTVINSVRSVVSQKSNDGVIKLLVESGGDNQRFECVLLPYENRVSCCLSTQVGCAMGCAFCATGLGGYDRNLTAGEIVGQYLLLQKLSSQRISHVVYMGMGEPLHNYDAVLKSLRLFHQEVGLSYRHITVSTVGLVPQILRLAKERLPIHLAISLHSPFDSVRGQIMPVAKRWSVQELLGACREYVSATKRKITFEYLLLEGINDTVEQAEALSELVRGIPCFVNLIPFNYVETESGFRRPSPERIKRFRMTLERRGVAVTQRVERGQDIAAACGQLKGEHEGRFARRRTLYALPSISA